MALAKLGINIAAAAGKVGGLVFQQTGGRTTMSTKSRRIVPRNKQTGSRMSFLREISSMWRTSILSRLADNIILNPSFEQIPFVWAAVRATFEYIAPNLFITGNGTGPNFYANQPFSNNPKLFYRLICSYKGSLSTGLSDAYVIIINAGTLSSIVSIKIPDPDSDYNFYFDYNTDVLNLRLLLFATPSTGISVWEFAYIYSLENSFQASWNAAAINFQKLNRFAESRKQSGYELFQSMNLNLKALGIDPIIAPPIPSDLPAILIQDATAELPDVVISYPFEILPANYAIMLSFSRCMPKSVAYCKKSWLKQYWGTVEIVDNQFLATPAYSFLFGEGSLIGGSHFFVQSQVFDTRSGERLISEVRPVNVV